LDCCPDLLAEVPGAGETPQLALAVVTGCNSSRGIVTFIDVYRRTLSEAIGLTGRRAPAHTAIRNILQLLDPAAVEASFRRHAAPLQVAMPIRPVALRPQSK
jgi:hypothetical protein